MLKTHLRICFLAYALAITAQCFTVQQVLRLDNKTQASDEEILDDPFLLLRTKAALYKNSYDLSESRIQTARFISRIPLQETLKHNELDATEESDCSCQVNHELTSDCFYFKPPRFHLSINEEAADTLWWQISTDENFSIVYPTLDECLPYSPSLTIHPIAQTFLNPFQTYFIRVRACQKNQAWGPWSLPFAFICQKPNPITSISFEKQEVAQKVAQDVAKVRLTWQTQTLQGDSQQKDSQCCSQIEYLIFGSNSLDFLPSIYADNEESTLCATTKNNHCLLDDTFSYYRIIAKIDESYSTASPLIHIYEAMDTRPRDVLVYNASEELLERVSLPETLSLESSWAKICERYPSMTYETLTKIFFYLLPDNHPIKARLDRFFSSFRITEDESSLAQAGFTYTKAKPYSQTVITKHPLFPGYVFKFFTDQQEITDPVHCLFKRILGANAARSAIEMTNSEHLFTVPRKWIYLIPPNASKYPQKECLVIAEEVPLLSYESNIKRWRSNQVSMQTLELLYTILNQAGLSDSIYPSNIQFTPEGKIAFIDTECSYWWPKPSKFPVLAEYLSEENSQYWLSLTD